MTWTGKYFLAPFAAMSKPTSNRVYPKGLNFISTENAVDDPSFRAIRILGFSFCHYGA